MKILNKQGHRDASVYLVDYCKELSLRSNKIAENLNILSSDSLCAKVRSQAAWWRDAASAIKPMKFDPKAAESSLSAIRLVGYNKNVSDFRASLVIYNALRDLPTTASVDWTLWSGLAFGACSEYMKARWHVPAPVMCTSVSVPDSQYSSDESDLEDETENKPKNQHEPIKRACGILLQRWIGRGFGTTALTRHGVGRLWWTARVADMASREPEATGKTMKHYLRILYADQNIQWSILLRRYGAMSRLVCVLLDKIYKDYLEEDDSGDKPYKLKSGKSINEVKEFTKLLNTSAGGCLYDLKQYKEMEHDVVQFQNLAKEGK